MGQDGPVEISPLAELFRPERDGAPMVATTAVGSEPSGRHPDDGGPPTWDPAQPHVAHGRLDRLTLAALAGDPSVAAARHTGAVKAGADATSEQWIDPVDAAAAIGRMGVVGLWGMEADCPELRVWLDRLGDELQVPGRYVTANGYWFAGGEGYRAHFDPYDVIVVQLAGDKTWAVAPEPDVVAPLQSFRPGASHDVVPDYLLPAVRRGAMPAPTLEVTLHPGSVLHLPGGWWHRTAAGRDPSWSVSVTFAPPSWAELIMDLVQAHLVTDPRFRSTARELLGPGPDDQIGRAGATVGPDPGADELARRLRALADALERGAADPDPLARALRRR